MSDPWWKEFGQAFWITIAGVLTGCMGVLVKAGLKSKCTSLKFCGFECQRDVRAELELEEFNAEHGIRADEQRTP